MSDQLEPSLAVRIERDIAETSKLNAETRKFVAEHLKLLAEQETLQAERAKLVRDRGLAPWLAITGLVGGIVAIATLLAHLRGWS